MPALIPLLSGDSLIQILAGAEAICTLEAGLAVVEGTRRAMPKQVGGRTAAEVSGESDSNKGDWKSRNTPISTVLPASYCFSYRLPRMRAFFSPFCDL